MDQIIFKSQHQNIYETVYLFNKLELSVYGFNSNILITKAKQQNRTMCAMNFLRQILMIVQFISISTIIRINVRLPMSRD